MRAAEVYEPGAKLKVVEREMPEPGPGKVRIKVDIVGEVEQRELGVPPKLSFTALSAKPIEIFWSLP
jgi:hypothetical protein